MNSLGTERTARIIDVEICLAKNDDSATAGHSVHVILAQSLVEYGSLSSVVSKVQELTYSIGTWLGDLSATQWTIVAIVVAGLFFLSRR